MTSGLEGTDCSGGLSRCIDGRLEASLTAHLPHPCREGERPGACACPWANIGSCPRGCASQGTEVVAAAAVARTQLCRPDVDVVRPLLPVESTRVDICADQDVACVEGVIRVCTSRGLPARLVAACAFGCATGITVNVEDVTDAGTPGAFLIGDGLASILCRRADAERR